MTGNLQDSHDWEAELSRYVPGKCCNVIFTDTDGMDTLCGNDCNPSEQLCHDCRLYGHRITDLL